MKVWLLNIIPASAVLLLAAGCGAATGLMRWVYLFAASAVLQVFFVQKWPKSVPLRWCIWRLRKGEKIELEGR